MASTNLGADRPAALHARQPLGELLVAEGLIDHDQLARALQHQAVHGGRLGEILIAQGAAHETDVRRILARQIGIEFVDLRATPPDPSVADALPARVCERAHALPIAREGDVLVVAMSNPSDLFAMDDLRLAAGGPVRAVLAGETQLAHWMEQVFGRDEAAALDEAIDDEAVEEPEAVIETAADAPIVRFVDGLLARAVRERASDVHVESVDEGLEVRFRIDGVLRPVMTAPRSVRGGVISRLKIMADLDIAERRVPQDGRAGILVDGRRIDLRVASLPTVHGESIVLRLLERSTRRPRTLADLGLSEHTRTMIDVAMQRGSGLVVVCGPTGSGKSTTLAAIVAELIRPELSVLTIEDPVEANLPGAKQMQVKPRAGFTFARALRAVLRADPDVIFVGEARDAETARIAAEAAMTGHLVLTSLHTADAAAVPVRLLDMGVEPYLVASSLACVVSQRLVRRLCTACREAYTPEDAELAFLGFTATPGDLVFFRSVGCPTCASTGYEGRIAACEVFVPNRAITRLILEQAGVEAVTDAIRATGTRPLAGDALEKVVLGVTDVQELVRVGLVPSAHPHHGR